MYLARFLYPKAIVSVDSSNSCLALNMEFSQHGLLCPSYGRDGISVRGSRQVLARNNLSSQGFALYHYLFW